MKSRTRASAVTAMAAGILLIAGCAAAPEATSSTPPTTTAPSESPIATPSAEPQPDVQDPVTWIISEAGIGPIQIGGDFVATLDELPDTWTNDQENCSWSAWWNAPDGEYNLFFVRGTETETAPISEISVSTSAEGIAPTGPVTAEGLGLGATAEEVLAAYPDAEEGTAQVDGTWIKLAGSTEGHVFFQYREGVSGAWAVAVTTRDEPSYEVCG